MRTSPSPASPPSDLDFELPSGWSLVLHTRSEHITAIATELLQLHERPPEAWMPPTSQGGDGRRPTASADVWKHTLMLDKDEDERQDELQRLRAAEAAQRGVAAPAASQGAAPPPQASAALADSVAQARAAALALAARASAAIAQPAAKRGRHV